MPPEALTMESLQESAGFITNRERGMEVPEARITEVWNLVYNSKWHGQNLRPYERTYLIREALTTSDFPLLFGDVLDRQVLANYKAVDPVWKLFSRQSTVPRIYPQVGGYRFAISGGDQFLAEVSQKGEYLASDRNEKKYELTVRKYGRQFDISWEALINDDVGALKDTPMRFAKAAVRTEHRLLTDLYADDDGTHGAGNLYDKATAGEINGSVALLTIANLEAGVEAMEGFLDTGGEPIMNSPKYLVVPPALKFTARQILTSANKMWVEGTGANPTVWPTKNVIADEGLILVIDPYLPVMDATNGGTGWYLFADPNDIAALEAAHLVGHERPEIVMKASDKVTIGGGLVGPMSGDFATDNVFYRVRVVFGTTKLDWRATYAGGLVS